MIKAKIANQGLSIKFAGLEHPQSVRVKEWTDAGVWIQSETLHIELAQLAGEKGIPGFLKRNPLVFLPFHRVEWVMAPASLLQSVDESTRPRQIR
jgi:hypothetical protein